MTFQTRLTPEVHDRLVAWFRADPRATQKQAAAYAGVGYRTLKGWLQTGRAFDAGVDLPEDLELRRLYVRGRDRWQAGARQRALATIGQLFGVIESSNDYRCHLLVRDIAAARADLERSLVAAVVKAAPRDWRAAAFLLKTGFGYSETVGIRDETDPAAAEERIAAASRARAAVDELERRRKASGD
jgi:hypothetical protein